MCSHFDVSILLDNTNTMDTDIEKCDMDTDLDTHIKAYGHADTGTRHEYQARAQA